MPIEFTTIGLNFLTGRWVFLLAKKHEKSVAVYTGLAVLVYLVGGSILTFIAAFSILMTRGDEMVYMDQIVAGLFCLLGALSVGIFYLFLRRSWRKKRVNKVTDTLLDDTTKH